MADSYVYRPLFGIWHCIDGEPVELVDPLTELNRLAVLAEDAANIARLTERTAVRHIIMAEDLQPEMLIELPTPPSELSSLDHGVLTSRAHYNRLLRTLKAIWEKTK